MKRRFGNPASNTFESRANRIRLSRRTKGSVKLPAGGRLPCMRRASTFCVQALKPISGYPAPAAKATFCNDSSNATRFAMKRQYQSVLRMYRQQNVFCLLQANQGVSQMESALLDIAIRRNDVLQPKAITDDAALIDALKAIVGRSHIFTDPESTNGLRRWFCLGTR